MNIDHRKKLRIKIYKLPVRFHAYNTPSTPVTTYWVPSSWYVMGAA
jgi:hypothetical protein